MSHDDFRMDEEARHAARRRAGGPTVSVLVGGGVDGQWPQTGAGGATGGVAEWFSRVAPRLAGDAAAGVRLGARLPELVRVPLPDGAGGWAQRLGAMLAAAGRDGGEGGWRLVAAVAEAVGAGGCPALTWRVEDAGELAGVMRFGARVAERCPGLAVVVRVPEAAVWERFERAAPESREKAMAREGLIFVEPPRPGASAAVTGAMPAFLERLPGGGAAWRERFAATVAAVGEEDGAEEGRARSAAERFLFDLLEALPDTRGLFRLNAALPFRFGLKVAEADLLAADLRLVVEVDGYRHFTDAEGYRRDRRKDLLLQREGYLVLRVLADDVVSRLEEILADIREAATFQRCRGRRGGGEKG